MQVLLTRCITNSANDRGILNSSLAVFHDTILLSKGWARLWSIASATGFFTFKIALVANLLSIHGNHP